MTEEIQTLTEEFAVDLSSFLLTACPITSSNTTCLAQSFTFCFDINIQNNILSVF
jgi:hypothetical protein